MTVRSVLAATLALAALAAASPAQPPVAKLDAHGDPLPPGAVARLGTYCGYHAFGWGQNSVLAADGRVLLQQGNSLLQWIDPATGRRVGNDRSTDDRDGTGSPVALTPDGTRGVFSWNDHVRVYDIATAKRLATIPATTRIEPRTAVISADGKTVAVGQGRAFMPVAGDVHAVLWDVDANAERRRVRVADAGEVSVALTPDGKTLLTRYTVRPTGLAKPPAETRVTQIWEAATGQSLGRLEAEGESGAFAFAPDSSVGAVPGYPAKTVELFDPRTGKRLHSLADPQVVDGARIAFTPDGKTVVAVGYSLVAAAWDVGTGKVVTQTPRPADLPPGGIFHRLVVTPDGRPTAWAVWDRDTAIAWNPLTGTLLTPAVRNVSVIVGVAFTADGKHLVTTDGSGVNVRWDAATGRPVGYVRIVRDAFGGTPPTIRPSADAAYGFSAGAVYDLATAKETAKLPPGIKISGSWPGIRPTADGRLLALTRTEFKAEAPGRCMLFDPAAGRAVIELPLPPTRIGLGDEYAAALTRDGKMIVVAFEAPPKPGEQAKESIVLGFDAATGKQTWERAIAGTGVALYPAGAGAVVAQVGGRIEALDAGTGKTTALHGEPRLLFAGFAAAPDGRRFATVMIDNRQSPQRVEFQVRAWPGGEVLAAVPGQGAPAPAAFSPDGTRLAALSGPTVILYDVAALPKPAVGR